MVDYNIAIPQQQLYQAPDPMQNFLRMQQMEQMGATSRLRNMQAQNLLAAQQQTAAERAQAAAIEEEASGAVRGGASPTEAAENLTREGKLGAAARISAHGKTLSEGQKAELDTVDNTLKGFGYWSAHVRSPEEAGSLGAGMYNTSRLRPFFESIGIKSPEQAAQKFSTDFATDENAWRTGIAKLDAPILFSLRAAKQVDLPGGGKGTIDPNRPGVINESVIREAGAPELTPGGGAGAGRVNTYPVNPTRVANMNAAAGRTGGAPILDDGGLAARADMGVNALAAGQRQQPAVVGNAMAAPVAAASPYGALAQPQAAPGVVGSREFAQRAKDAELAQAVKKAGLEAIAREQATATVKGETETKTRQETAGRVLQVLNDPVIDDLIVKSTSGSLQRNVAGKIGAFGTSTSGMENIGRLNTIQESLLFRLANGKLGGGFTDKDTDTIRGMLGRIADPDTPANVRVKTLQDVRAMMQSVATGENMTLAPAAGGKSRRATAQPAAAASPAAAKAPAIGAVDGGYRFKGGDPSKVDSWEKM